MFLHLPLYRGDGNCAVEGLLSTQSEKEVVTKGGEKRRADGQEQNARKKGNGRSQSLAKPDKLGTREKEMNMSNERTGSQLTISKQKQNRLLQQEK